CTHHIPIVFGIELAGESSRIHQITEHDGELAAFCVRGARRCYRECHLGSRLLLWRTGRERLISQRRTTGTAELEAGWIFKATLRTQVLESMTTLPAELHPVGVVKATV